jgi:hypothetical protein
MGNEAGDLDSLVSAMALSFTYNHLEPPQKAVALLQTDQGEFFSSFSAFSSALAHPHTYRRS